MIAKTQHEIDTLRVGGTRLAQHLKTLSGLVAPGVRPAELEAKAREMVAAEGDEMAFFGYDSGGKDHPFPSGLCVSVNDVIVHCPASEGNAPIEDGDIVCLDFGIKHGGFFTDHAVTVIAGEKRDPEDVRMVKAAYEALDAGIAQARVGNTTGDIGHAVERVAKKYGLGFPRNLCGHGVGAQVHEEPHVPNFGAPKTGSPIVENLVIAIEPMFTRGSGDLFVDKDGFSYRTKDGSRTAHAEHTVLITKDGPEVLTKV